MAEFGIYNATTLALTDGQQVQRQVDNTGAMKVAMTDGAGGVLSGASSWNYAAPAGGIVNSAVAVTIKAAAGAGVRNYLKSLHVVHDLLGAATELAIRDGAAGTVLWRGRLQTPATDSSGGHGTTTFDPPLRSSANTLLEVVTLTAVTGGVYVNATGYTGA